MGSVFAFAPPAARRLATELWSGLPERLDPGIEAHVGPVEGLK